MRFLVILMSLIACAAQAQIERTVRPFLEPKTELMMMQMVPVCAPGVAVGVSGTRFICLSDLTVNDLPNKQHSSIHCRAAGGEVVNEADGTKFCRFNAAVCPNGWTQYKNWSTTSSDARRHGSCEGAQCQVNTSKTWCGWGVGPQYRPYHNWNNVAAERCTTRTTSDCRNSGYCVATPLQIGCY